MLTSGNQFDLLIINISIPGNENCRSLKRLKLLWPHLRIIAITGFDCANRYEICQPTGCDTMISHNIDAYDMRAVVNEMFYPVN
jgi:DNA-binding NarL/FixJ family response regulator